MDRQCATCGKKFSRATTMRRHALLHAAPDEGRTYKCGTCERTFQRADHLSRHRRIHTGGDLKDCIHCGRGFRRDYLPLHHKACRGLFEHDSDLKHLPEHGESRASKDWYPSVVPQVNPPPQLERSGLVKPVRFVNETASNFWDVARKAQRVLRTNTIRSVDGAIRNAEDVLAEAKRLVCNDDLLGLKDLISSLEPQWAKITTFLQLADEAIPGLDDTDWLYDSDCEMCLLEHAAGSGALEVLRYLLSPWSDLKAAPVASALLNRAVHRGHLEVMNFLVRDKGADLDFLSYFPLGCDVIELKPLAVAIVSGDIDIVKHLFDLGCNLQAYCDEFSTPAVSFALKQREQDIAQWLIDHGATVTKNDRVGRTTLHYAAGCGALSIMRTLLRSGAEIDAGDVPYMKTPLCYAAQHGQIEAMRLLLESGAKGYGISECVRGTPLYAAFSGVKDHGSSALDLLVAWRVDLDRLYEDEGQMCTILSLLCRWKESDEVKCLLDAGAGINLGDRTPLREAWQHGSVEMVALLLSSGAKYEHLQLEEVPVKESWRRPATRDKKLLTLQAWKEERARAGSLSG